MHQLEPSTQCQSLGQLSELCTSSCITQSIHATKLTDSGLIWLIRLSITFILVAESMTYICRLKHLFRPSRPISYLQGPPPRVSRGHTAQARASGQDPVQVSSRDLDRRGRDLHMAAFFAQRQRRMLRLLRCNTSTVGGKVAGTPSMRHRAGRSLLSLPEDVMVRCLPMWALLFWR